MVLIVDDDASDIQTGIGLSILMQAVHQDLNLAYNTLSLLCSRSFLIEILLQVPKSTIGCLQLCLNDVEVMLLALLDNEHVVCKHNAVLV